jgi:hypothetical protein
LQLALPSGCALQIDGDDATPILAEATNLSIKVAGQIAAIYLR